jgi:hypothetical protein
VGSDLAEGSDLLGSTAERAGADRPSGIGLAHHADQKGARNNAEDEEVVMGFRRGGLRTIKVKSPKSRVVLGVKTVSVKATTVKPSNLWVPRKPK